MKSWKDAGYGVALLRDPGAEPVECADLTVSGRYRGYSQSVNMLASLVMNADPECLFIIAAGDDTMPDASIPPDQIASELIGHAQGTMLVCQPTGDPWRDVRGRIIERIAGSPWLGREWCRRINQGRGPLWPEYTHCFADEELQCVAQRLGVFWQRPDLVHLHHNWARKEGATYEDMPAFLSEANSAAHWAKYSALFHERKAAGFPGSEPIA